MKRTTLFMRGTVLVTNLYATFVKKISIFSSKILSLNLVPYPNHKLTQIKIPLAKRGFLSILFGKITLIYYTILFTNSKYMLVL